jgi:DNA-binding XRE family transcriptional regulator
MKRKKKKARKEHGIANSRFGKSSRKEIGKNIELLRRAKNISCAALAKATGVSVPQIYNIEAGACAASIPVLYILSMLLDPDAKLPLVGDGFIQKWKSQYTLNPVVPCASPSSPSNA